MRAVLYAGLLLLPAAALMGGCDDTFLGDPILARDTAFVAAPTSESGRATAIDLSNGNAPRRPEFPFDAQQWDLQLRQNGGAFFLAPIQNNTVRRGAGVRAATGEFEQIDEAPRDRDTYSNEPIAVTEGSVYFAHSRDITGAGCHKWAKLRILDLDAAAGTADLVVVSNQSCDDERLTLD